MIIDTWAALSHKSPLSSIPSAGRSWLAPSWTGMHGRRLAAYKVLSAYLNNVAREFLVTRDNAKASRDRHVEYGDPVTLRNAIVGTLMGDEQTIVVDGADDPMPDVPNPDDVIDPNSTVADGPSVESERARISAARDRQAWLREWADAERLARKVFETERNAVGLGDGVYVLRWSVEKQRPRIVPYDPGFYFPVLSMNDEEDFPTTVHLAWEYDETEGGETHRWVRRITYRLAPIAPRAPEPLSATKTIANLMTGTVAEVELPRNATQDASGQFTRSLPWNDTPTSITCYLTDAKWRLEDVGRRLVQDIDFTKAQYEHNEQGDELRDLDLEIDFLPVVHVPNTVAESEHYGRSVLLDIAQILDELAAADTDLSAAAATTGTPAIALSGGAVGDLAYGPGKVWNLPLNGRLDVMDTSKALDALLKYIDALLNRLSTNARVPASVVGRIDPSEIASGVLLALSFGPLKQLITEMRLVRDEKYPLLLKIVQRLAIAGGVLQGDVEMAQLEFGSFLPSDRAEAVKLVRSLLGNGTEAASISRVTALRLLVEAGFDLGDATEELDRIEAEDFHGAESLLRATGDEGNVFEYLQRQPTPGGGTPGPPPPLVPNQPQGAPQGLIPTLPGPDTPLPPPNAPAGTTGGQ